MNEDRRRLNRQVEEILDTYPGRTVSVIVQTHAGEDLGEFLDAAAETIGRRQAAPSARLLIPPASKALAVSESGRLTAPARRRLAADKSPSARSLMADFALPALDRKDLLTAGRRALKGMLDSDFVKEVSGKKGREEMTPFLTSSSVGMELTRDELAKLPAALPEAVDVFPNRVIRVPPVVRAADVPTAVAENTRYTWGISRTGALACWGAFGVRGAGVKVAVLDTGVDAKHPDLKGKIVAFAEFDAQGKTVVDDVSKAYDSDEHGTHCAGTIVGGSASGRWIGMAPEAQIMSGLVLKGGFGTDKQILAGMDWAISSGAHVISMSLGGLRLGADVLDTYTRTILNANRLGIPVVIAVGNEGSQTSGSPGNDLFAFTVGATDVDDRPAGFSGGRTQIINTSRYIDSKYLPLVFSKPEITAPGVDVYSSIPGGKWDIFSGTSMATPHVAGAIALLLSKPTEPKATKTLNDLTGRQRVSVLQQLLIGTVKELGEAGQDHRYGYGRIDVLRAVSFAISQGYFGEEFADT